MDTLAKKKILGIGVTNGKQENILQYIITSLEKKTDPYYIVTPNPEMVVRAARDKHFQSILNQARIALPDGVGLVMAAKILGDPIYERITGADFMELLCKEVAKKPITVGFLGGGRGVAEKTADCLSRKYPGLKIGFIGEEWEGLAKGKEQRGKGGKIDILFVAFGFPKQEEWMAAQRGKIPVSVMMGVGGAFDYISGEVARAPFLLRALGLEWLYRLIRQPWRWRRQLALSSFILLVGKELFVKSSSSSS